MSDVNKAMANRWNEELWNKADFSSANDFLSEPVSFESNHVPST